MSDTKEASSERKIGSPMSEYPASLELRGSGDRTLKKELTCAVTLTIFMDPMLTLGDFLFLFTGIPTGLKKKPALNHEVLQMPLISTCLRGHNCVHFAHRL